MNTNSNFINNVQHWVHDTKSIQFIGCNFNANYYKPELFDELDIYFPNEIKKAVKIRQAEFLAGRFAAKNTLMRAGVRKENTPSIMIGKHRQPIWPQDFIGSITHNKFKAICVLGKKIDTKYIGIDIENILSDHDVSDISYQIHNNKELKILLTQGISSTVATSLLFSAKESIFKALYPSVGHYFGFECARLASVDLRLHKLTFHLDDDLALKASLASKIECIFEHREGTVFTLVSD